MSTCVCVCLLLVLVFFAFWFLDGLSLTLGVEEEKEGWERGLAFRCFLVGKLWCCEVGRWMAK